MSDSATPHRYADAHRMVVPGGWIYYGGPLVRPVHVLDPKIWGPDGLDVGTILTAIATLSQKVTTMSASVSSEIDALTAKFQTDLDGITSQISDLHGQIVTLQGEMSPGSQVTQAQVDKLTALEAQAAALAVPATVTAPPATPPTAPPAAPPPTA